MKKGSIFETIETLFLLTVLLIVGLVVGIPALALFFMSFIATH